MGMGPRAARIAPTAGKIFLTALRSDVPGGSNVTAEVDALLVEVVDAEGISHYLRRAGKRWQLREYWCTARCITSKRPIRRPG